MCSIINRQGYAEGFFKKIFFRVKLKLTFLFYKVLNGFLNISKTFFFFVFDFIVMNEVLIKTFSFKLAF